MFNFVDLVVDLTKTGHWIMKFKSFHWFNHHNTVEARYNEGPRDSQNMFAI